MGNYETDRDCVARAFQVADEIIQSTHLCEDSQNPLKEHFAPVDEYLSKRNKERDCHQLMRRLQRQQQKRRWRIVGWSSVAAVVAVGVILSFYLLPGAQDVTKKPLISGVPVIKLDNGEVIPVAELERSVIDSLSIGRVTAGAISYNGVETEGDPVYNTLQIPAECIYTITLSDGTTVTLNAGACLRYPIDMSRERKVWLQGEAFFEVAKTGSRFTVVADKVNVHVYGTRFNVFVNDELKWVETTLLSGRVGVETDYGEIMLSPNQKCVCRDGSAPFVVETSAEEAIVWSDKKFKYTDVNLDRILYDISQWYGVEITCDGAIGSTVVTIDFDKSEDLDWILTSLERILSRRFVKQEGGAYRVE